MIRGLDAGLFTNFVEMPATEFVVGRADFSASWTNGPLYLELDLASLRMEAYGTSYSASATAKGDARGFVVEKFSVLAEDAPVATASGFLPIAIHPAHTNIVQPHPDAPVRLDVSVQPKAFFWNRLAEVRGVRLREPQLEAHVTGTWNKLLGSAELRARGVTFTRLEGEVPSIGNLALKLQVMPEMARLEALTFAVSNQPVALTGQIPLPEGFWSSLPRKPQFPDWRTATGHLQIDGAQVAALTPFLSGLLAPVGVLNADVSLLPNGQLDGELRIDGVNTRPLENVGAIRDIEVVCRLEGRQGRFRSAGFIGGELAVANGLVDLSAERWHQDDRLPPFQIQITGSNVPLTRRSEAILRADLNVAVTNVPKQTPVISGAVRMRNSFYLQELAALVPGDVASPSRRPPYFHTEQKPFADWRLALAITGDNFLKVRTPLFQGEVSADVQLQGTLQDPVAVGEVKISSGAVRLPFANLPITQGYVTLSSDNPYQPQLFVTAAARVFGYDVKMDVTGPADHPVVQLSSTPPLSSEQILLMVMAGEVPRSDFTLSSQQRAQRVALFFGRNVLSDLGLLGDANRLTIRSGENVSEGGDPTYTVEYQLTDDWAIVGEYDRFNDYNLMLQWRVYPW
jgi:translocation and assembly module TamB